MKKQLILSGLLVLTLFIGLYAKRKIHDPKFQLGNVKNLALVVGFTYEPQRKEERLARNNKTVQH